MSKQISVAVHHGYTTEEVKSNLTDAGMTIDRAARGVIIGEIDDDTDISDIERVEGVGSVSVAAAYTGDI